MKHAEDVAVGAAMTALGNIALDIDSRTDVGLRREVNEDSVLAVWPVFLVADGMGGHSAGDRASQAAIEAMAGLVQIAADRPLRGLDVEEALARARSAVAEIARHAERGAGCTISGVVLIEHEGVPLWYVINVGDSRVYQYRGGSLEQVTRDHSLAGELAAAGHRDAAYAPKNVITRALGSDDPQHDAWLLPVRTGSTLLICSDGLTTEVDDARIREILGCEGDSAELSERLVREALSAGGHDNVTVAVVRVITGTDDERDSFGGSETEEDVEETTLDITRPVDQ